MIAVDSSALLAVAFRDAGWEKCHAALEREEEIMVSAATLAETLVVAGRRGILPQMRDYIASLELKVIPADGMTASRVSDTYEIWGKGVHPATLNIFDCFSYDVARQFDCPLLYIGNDFAQTDIASALG